MLISLGFLAKRFGLLKKEHATILNNIIIYLTMPALIFRAVYESKISLSLLKIPVLAIVIGTVIIIVAYIIGRFLHHYPQHILPHRDGQHAQACRGHNHRR